VKWKLDLEDVFRTLRGTTCMELILRKLRLVTKFREVDTIPSLIVREEHFHTICQQRPSLKNRSRLLLPIHPALYND
jgi:hypothetical protein